MPSPITSVAASSLESPPDAVPRNLTPSAVMAQVRVQVDRFAPLIAGVALVLLWEAACRIFKIPSFLLPAPTVIVAGAMDQTWAVWLNHIWATARVALLGYLLSIAISVPLAIALASSRLLSRTIYPIIVVVQATPIVAVAPIIVVSLGVSDVPRIVITFLITFFPIVVATTTGILAAPPEMIELSRSLRAGRTREMLHIRLPFAVPHIFSALRISITLAFVGAVVAEFVAAEEGLGYFIQFATSFFKIAQAFAALVVLVCMSLVAFQLVTLAQGLLAPWSMPKADDAA